MSSEPLLEVEQLSTYFHTERATIRAIEDVSFTVNRGETVGLVGESGAGKSVTISSILRMVDSPGQVVQGTIRYKGRTILDVDRDEEGNIEQADEMLSPGEMRSEILGNEIAVIFQDPMESLNPVYTIGDQLREVIMLNRDLGKRAAKEEAIRTLRKVGIPTPEAHYDAYPHKFSGGMRQRVLISMALACDPDLIIADEPTTALDVTVEGQIINLVNELKDDFDTSFIWVTHDLAVIAELCDRVNVMYLGNIVEHAPIEELFYDTQHPYTEALMDSTPSPDQHMEELTPIGGEIPNAVNPPTGCSFHPRCQYAREVCTRVDPEAKTIQTVSGTDHRAACLKHDVFDAEYEESTPLEKISEPDQDDTADKVIADEQ